MTENDVENRNFEYLATSGYFVHDFEELNIEKVAIRDLECQNIFGVCLTNQNF